MAVSVTAMVPTVPPATPIADARRRPSSVHVQRPRIVERARGTAHPSVPNTRPLWPSAPRHDVG